MFEEIYDEFIDYWNTQTRPMTAIEAAKLFVDDHRSHCDRLCIDPTDLSDYYYNN